MHKRSLVALSAAIAILAALLAWTFVGDFGARATRTVRVVAAFPHDPKAFTQGLVVHDGRLLESTGQYGASSLRRVDIRTGRVENLLPIDAMYFAEGIAVLDDRVYQLTWQNGIGFVYDAKTFAVERTFRYTGEGWGLTTDGTHLILSDGTSALRFLDPQNFSVVRQVTVTDAEIPVVRINELEYVEGEIWANIWYSDRIARIAPGSGEVVGWIDLSTLYPRAGRPDNDVLNGIAYTPAEQRLFVTGKNWPQLFELAIDGL
ncbi:MAG TPA: glutaminyl-peptide cyclotransferase [Gammaproteobacteria bacterium]|jgi:glutamine cyclotransferase